VEPRHFQHWPPGLARTLPPADETLLDALERTAARHAEKPALVEPGCILSWGNISKRAAAVAAALRERYAVQPGDPVLLCAQNGADFVVSFYAILRAGAVVVPLAPMYLASELAHYRADSGARVAIVESEVAERFSDIGLAHLLIPGRTPVSEADPGPCPARPADLCLMPYTSGSTGKPKGCMHTHRTVLHNIRGAVLWKAVDARSVALATAPFFHVTGLVHSFLATAYAGGTIVVQRRWDPGEAARLIERYRCTHWDNVPTMVVDLLAQPEAERCDLSSLRCIFGGGQAMPEAVARRLEERLGIRYIEGYGLTETISQTHINPPQRPKRQCLGIPTFDTEALVVDPDTLAVLPPGAQGEILVRGPQLFIGYWKKEEDYARAWAEVEGKRYFRTGDLGRMDEDGYFYISDRLKRMINAAGYKVWPTEVEAVMYRHPAIKECCVIAAPDERRGETVKAVVVLEAGARAQASEIIAWARTQMAPYKVPRSIEFVAALPRTASGKIQWRALQEKEYARAEGRSPGRKPQEHNPDDIPD